MAERLDHLTRDQEVPGSIPVEVTVFVSLGKTLNPAGMGSEKWFQNEIACILQIQSKQNIDPELPFFIYFRILKILRFRF